MVTPGGRFAIVYNGELYNDAELRRELEQGGHVFRSTSDTETILAAVARWEWEAIPRLRGMYAMAIHDAERQRLLLARDPLGIKPLYFWRYRARGAAHLLFASEARAIASHPEISLKPDMASVSAYLCTIRTTTGERTLFDGVRAVRPGEVIEVDLRAESLPEQRWKVGLPRPGIRGASAPELDERVRCEVEKSVLAHLRSDVPICGLLSGGLDSTIIGAIASDALPELWTYCAGATSADESRLDDLRAAQRVSQVLGSRHAEAVVTRELFAQRWPEMIERTGLPLSTPNEVAINEVARRLRADGKVVTVSGEGADELFGGYDVLLDHAAAFESTLPERRLATDEIAAARGRFHAEDAAWVPLAAKAAVLSDRARQVAEGDAVLLDVYAREYADLAAEGEAGEHPIQVHLRFQRRVNLAGLLLRLDSATMLEGVEGRTPFADSVVAGLAESLPASHKFDQAGPLPRTKLCLRRGFASAVPDWVLARPKASFPLPFQAWCADAVAALDGPGPAREFFSDAAIESVRQRPAELWSLSWPVLNIAMWARRWWG